MYVAFPEIAVHLLQLYLDAVGRYKQFQMLANVPVVFLGKAFASRLPLKAIHYGAAALFAVLGVIFLCRALWH